jgi:hypothetical protein
MWRAFKTHVASSWKWASGADDIHVYLILAGGAVLGGHSLLLINRTARITHIDKDGYLLQGRLLGAFDFEQPLTLPRSTQAIFLSCC